MSGPRFSSAARSWLAAAALVGFGQQVFVVLRNPYVLAAGHSDDFVGAIQGAGGAAGIAAGTLALFAASRIRDATLLTLAVLANAVGYAAQIAWTTPASLVAGAAIAGLGIQGITTAAAPFLARHSTAEERVSLFATHALALQAIPGALGALASGYAERAAASATGSVVDGHRVALGLGAIAVALGVAPLLLLRSAPPQPASRPRRLRDRAHVARLIAPDVLLFAGNGLSIPFLQIYLERRYALTAASVGSIYAVATIAAVAPHFAAPRLAKRFGAERATMLVQGVGAAAVIALALAPTAALAATAFVVRHASAGAGAALYSSVLHTRVDPDDSDAAASYRMIADSIVWAAANFAAGSLIEHRGFPFVLACTAGAYLGAIAIERSVFATRAGAR